MSSALTSTIETETVSGWEAQLDLKFAVQVNKTVLSARQQRGPLAVQRAFYPEGDVCHLYILHPPGGVVGGDRLYINVDVGQQANTLLTTPGATKYYKSQGDTAHQQQRLTVDEGAALEWFPQENIYFPGAKVHLSTHIDLTPTAQFIGWEMHCFGLPANQQKFTEGRLQLDFMLSRNERPLLIEKMNVEANKLESPTGLRNNSVMAIFLATPANNSMLEMVRTLLTDDNNVLIAATLVEDCLLVRYLGDSTEQCRKIFTRLWGELRPLVLKRKACSPRIWAT
ncbi:MAG: urease accessory protein [Cycloclasticus pugetii]|jgi:urease accessory protein|uniref:urease accessory protein UreD n=1 Tax=Cycloclasticus TaxID=34067 RepID=UPI0004193FCD|nr:MULTISPECIES: urease accessory protein UreD [Cycloclasticus]MBV1897861.1 urease accessory protein UreD [Cycloclasticus sp.]MDF1829504.1 urease accessory protein UreD [Cycloclasticus pugetii]